MTRWFDYPFTLPHGVNGEQGVDIGTPFHTPLTAIDPGVVDVAKFGPFGGLIGVQTVLGEEYYLHADTEEVRVGQHVAKGQELGLSGGQLSGGAHPASPQFSSGPHTEFGLFTGKLFASPAIDPTGIINAARAGTAAPAGIGGLIPDPGAAINGALTSAGHGLANALAAGLGDIGTFFQRQIIALAVALVIAIVLFA